MNIKGKWRLLLGILVVSLVFGGGRVSADTLWVNSQWSGSNNGDEVGSGLTFGDTAFASIHASIDEASAEDTIHVLPGSYEEKIIIQDEDDGLLMLKAETPGTSDIINGVGIHIRPQASGSLVQGFNIFPETPEETPESPTISGLAGLGYIDMNGAQGVNFTQIHANDISNFPFGIGVLGGNHNVFGSAQYLAENDGAYMDDDGTEYDNYIHNNAVGIAAAGVEGGSLFGDGVSTVVGNYIGKNYITNNYAGVGLIGAEHTTIEGNKIMGGSAGNCAEGMEEIIGTGSLDSSLLGIGLLGIEELSIGSDTLLEVPANNNTILRNTISDHYGMGIVLLGSGENNIGWDPTEKAINGNTITNNDTAGLGIIGVDSFNISFPDPDLQNPMELTIKLPANNNRIFGNNIQDNNGRNNNDDGMGIWLLGSGGNQIGGANSEKENTINNNGLAGLGIIGVDNFSIDISDPEDLLPQGAPSSLLSLQLAANNNDILGNEIKDNNGMGIWLLGSGGNDIEDNRIIGNGSAGIGVTGVDEISIDMTELVGNIIKSMDESVTIPGVINLAANDNDILGNKIKDNNGMGIWLLGSGENNIADNEVKGNGVAGIGIVGVEEISVDANKLIEDIVTSVIAGLPDDMSVSMADIRPFIPEDFIASVNLPANSNTVVGNTIRDNGAFGIGLLGSSDNEIRNNEAIDNNLIGIGALGVNRMSYLQQILEEVQPSMSLEELGDSFFEKFGPLTSFFELLLGVPGLSYTDEVLESLEIPGVIDLIDAGVEGETFTCISQDNTISYNYIRGNEAAGIGLLNSNENTIEYNKITNTTEGGSLSSKLPGFKDKDIPGTGIVLSDADNNKILNNVIQDNEVGIYLVENLIEDEYFENPGAPEGNFAHYNSISGNSEYGVLNETTETFDAALNWWGDRSGPYHSTENPDGTGDQVSANVIFSPWIGMNPDDDPGTVGVQLRSPLTFVVDDAGPVPGAGYLNTAVTEANELQGSDTIEVHNGEYETSPNRSVTESVTIVSCKGCPMGASLDGELSITAEDVQIGGRVNYYTTKGFNIEGDVTVEGDVDASTVHINWNNISGTVTNTAAGTLDAEYNWWGDPDGPMDEDSEGAVEGDVDYTPFLRTGVCAVMEYMEENDITNLEDAAAGMIAQDASPSEQAAAQLIGLGLTPEEAEELINEYGRDQTLNALEEADSSEEFLELLAGYRLAGGGAGGITNNVVVGGAGSIGGKTVGSVFKVCDLIKINFALSDFEGGPAKDLAPTVSLVKLDDEGEKENLERVTTASYTDPKKAYQATFSSCELPPGYYQAQVDLTDGSSLNQVLKIECKKTEKAEEA